ncbi:MAG: Stage II sporulation protein E [uncultured Thermomicrobiales bacterium]|uniref:Stage II sporulation protein E n=1 Tax=uncultured Thermomicrobiales bacterium TaxID=1645740 RepID=A0A6J4UG72_9BACT|nr:MAG: Stage II sporulation protein E [uncultured Thermomicrobiales bacterium]
MGLAIDVAIAKTNKYASRESGDTAELIERPGGGLSVVLADGQGSGRAAKTLSLLVTSKAVALLKDGVRDGAVARAVHDFLFAYRHGQVSATLEILSVDLRAETVVLTRNAATLAFVGSGERYGRVDGDSGPIGLYAVSRPTVLQLPLAAGLRALLATDGVGRSGVRGGAEDLDLAACAAGLGPDADATAVADGVLAEAVLRDAGRPADDMTVVALALRPHRDAILVRRQGATVPLP